VFTDCLERSIVQISFGQTSYGIAKRFLFVNPLLKNKQTDMKINRRVIYEINTDQGLLSDNITGQRKTLTFQFDCLASGPLHSSCCLNKNSSMRLTDRSLEDTGNSGGTDTRTICSTVDGLFSVNTAEEVFNNSEELMNRTYDRQLYLTTVRQSNSTSFPSCFSATNDYCFSPSYRSRERLREIPFGRGE
jgi:hypothetical protein